MSIFTDYHLSNSEQQQVTDKAIAKLIKAKKNTGNYIVDVRLSGFAWTMIPRTYQCDSFEDLEVHITVSKYGESHLMRTIKPTDAGYCKKEYEDHK